VPDVQACPKCGSYKTKRRSGLLWIGVALLVAGVLALAYGAYAASAGSSYQPSASDSLYGALYGVNMGRVASAAAVGMMRMSFIAAAVLAVFGISGVYFGLRTGPVRCGSCGYELGRGSSSGSDSIALEMATRSYSAWLQSCSDVDLAMFHQSLVGCLPLFAGLGMSAASWRQQFPEAAGAKDFEDILTYFGYV
jgi:hypothetical protein